MTLTRQHALTLPATPRAVQLARSWVGDVLREIGRTDLTDSAELGVSELVTNAIIHSTPPVAVRIGGSQEHPRIEVADRSPLPPRIRLLPDDPQDDLLLTFGRGLALVAVHSAAWGSDPDRDGLGKTVWFEPVREPDVDAVPAGDVHVLDDLPGRHGTTPPQQTVEIRLLGAPVADLLDLTRYYAELRRELRLVAVTNPERYPLAVQFSELAVRVEDEHRQMRGVEDVLAEAVRAQLDRVDLVGVAPASAPETMDSLRVLLARVYAFLDEESMLAAHPTPRQVAVQEWYLGQFVRQGSRGESPAPWEGGYADLAQHAAS